MKKKFYGIRTEEIVVYRVEATSEEEALDKFRNIDEDVVEWHRGEVLAYDVSEW